MQASSTGTSINTALIVLSQTFIIEMCMHFEILMLILEESGNRDCQIPVLRNNVSTLEECVYCVAEIWVYNSIVMVELIFSALTGQTLLPCIQHEVALFQFEPINTS